MPTPPLNIYLVEKHGAKKVGGKKSMGRVKGQESHNRRVGNSPLGPPPIESVGYTFDIF